MTMAKSEFSQRFTGSEMLRTIPAKQSQRDEIARLTDAALNRGLVVQVGPPPTFTPRDVRPPAAVTNELWSLTAASAASGIAVSTIQKRLLMGSGPTPVQGTGKKGDPRLFNKDEFMRWAKAYKGRLHIS